MGYTQSDPIQSQVPTQSIEVRRDSHRLQGYFLSSVVFAL